MKTDKRAKLAGAAVRVPPAVVFLAVFGWLLYCAAPTLYWGDSAEMVSVTCDMGVAHSPGYPLYTQVARLFGGLPLEPLPFRVNLSSVFLASLAALLLYLAVVEISGSVFAGLVAVAGLAGCRAFVYYGLIAEVYPLHLALFSGALLLLAKARAAGASKYVAAALLIIFIGITHHLLMVFTLAAAIVYLALLPGHKWRVAAGPFLFMLGAAFINLARAFDELPLITTVAFWSMVGLAAIYAGYLVILGLKRKGLMRALAAALATLAVFAAVTLVFGYLPLASAREPMADWWSPKNTVNFLNLLFLKGYESTLPADRLEWFRRLDIGSFPLQMSFLMMGFAAPGLLFLFRKNWRLAVFLLLTAVGTFGGTLIVSHGKPDALRLPVFVVMYALAGLGAAAIPGWRVFRGALWKRVIAGIAAILIAAVTIINMTDGDWRLRDMNKSAGAYELGRMILDDARSNSIVFLGLQTPSIMGYFEACETAEVKRREIALIPVSFLPFRWELEQLKRKYPLVRFPDAMLLGEETPVFRVEDPARARYAVEMMKTNPGRAAYSDFLFIPRDMDYLTVPRGAIYMIVPKEAGLENLDEMLETDATPEWQAWKGIDELSAENIASVHNERGKVYLEFGMERGEEKYFRTALKEFNRALEFDPAYARAISNKGQTMFFFGQGEKGMKLMEQSLTLDPTDPQLYEVIATIKFRQQTPQAVRDAITYWLAAFTLDQHNARALHNVASALVALEQKEAAVEYYRRAIQIDPEYISPYINLARVYNQMGICSKAVEILDKAKDLSPDMLWLRIELAEQYYNCSLQHLYAREVDEIMKEFPRDLELLYALSILFRNVGQYENLARAIQEIRKLDPEFPIQRIFSSLEPCERAIRVLDETRKHIPDEAQLYLTLGMKYGACGMFPEAEAIVQEALRRFPEHRKEFNFILEQMIKAPQGAPGGDPYEPFIEGKSGESAPE